jgi:signal transduction histidine kinase
VDFRKHDEYSSAMRNLLLGSINAMGDSLALFEDTFTIVYTNKAAENIFNYRIGDCCCKGFQKSKIHDESCSVQKAIVKNSELKVVETIPISFIKDPNLYIPELEDNICELIFESIYTPILDKDSNSWGCIKLSRNLTHNRSLENKLKKIIIEHSRESEKNKEKLDDMNNKSFEIQQQIIQTEKLLSLGKLSAGISHEIYNSLSVLGPRIKMFGSYLDKILDIFEEYRKLHRLSKSESIEEELQRILQKEKEDRGIDFYINKLQKFIAPCNSELYSIEKIVESLNEFTNLQKADSRHVNLNDELENTLILLEYEFTNNKIEIIKRYDPSLKSVPCFPADLNQVFLNILTNCIESLKEKASKSSDFKPIIKITSKRDNNFGVISFHDNGSGFQKENTERIFDPFFTTKSPTINAGLGLSSTKTIIEKQHKGKIIANTEQGEFAEFILKLPLDDNPSMTLPPPDLKK